MKYLIKNGRVVDPAAKTDAVMDLLVSDGKIAKVGKSLTADGAKVIDASSKIVAPGLIDMHTHLREPGREDKETIASGTRAALRGAYTTVLAMPNTEPAIDDARMVRLVNDIVRKDALVNVLVAGAITMAREGKETVGFKVMKESGVVAFTDDGSSVEDKTILLAALKEAKKENLLIIEHCEDIKISNGGVINRGLMSTKMGLRGIPAEAEYERVGRDIELAKKSGARIHIAHVSCKRSIELIRKARADGVKVTAEVTPHHLGLTEECCVTYDTNMKMNPPLRPKDDVAALKAALADGTIDAIATDHAPHTDAEKDVEFDCAPFGVIGLETALSIAFMELVEPGIISWSELIARMSLNPAKILGLERGSLKEGSVADIVIIDPNKQFVYAKDSIESRSKNSPFIGWTLKARATHVFVAGKLMMEDGKITG